MTPWLALRSTVRGALSESECAELAWWASRSGAKNSVEVGHYYGLSTCVLLDSLPDGSRLTTIDHHQGDHWSGKTRTDEFEANILPHRGRVDLVCLYADFRDAMARVIGEVDFLFYDADHSRKAVEAFWPLVRFADHALVLFDDADWDEQGSMREMAEADGFHVCTRLPLVRMPQDKASPDTYTLEVMVR